nr:GntR family transcriptional regulator [Natronoglycomyces albus]
MSSQDPLPLHEQLAGSIRRALVDGKLKPGDRIPPAKELAEQLDINANTALRALRDLRDEGLLEFRRGRGIRVCPGAEVHGELQQLIVELLGEANRLGYTRADLITLIERTHP